MNAANAVVIYHAQCDDGFGAAFACWLKLGDAAQYIPARYGDLIPSDGVLADKDVYVVDFSFSLEAMNGIQNLSNSLVVLDHHKTAREALAGMIPREQDIIVFDMERSGAMLAWNFFNPEQIDDKAAMLIRYVQDRDLWTKKLEGCDNFTRRLRSFPMDFTIWSKILKDAPEDIIIQGEAIDEYFQTQLAQILVDKHPVKFQGIPGYAVCATKMFSSEAGHALAELEGSKFGCTYHVVGNKISISLRSVGDICDVSAIAKKWGGGGHKNAAGCTLDLFALTSLVHGSID